MSQTKESSKAAKLPCRKCAQDLSTAPVCTGGTLGATAHRHCQNPKCLTVNPEKAKAQD